ncbi:FAD-dependent oxidoreductase [Benzoatithermus flavus]|uniref:FAD-dependent oxidoreductase n=1 Tax=Benzoatithermus flavus TaxID=3108223 RepID=A0ABU8XS88_9PROT
MTTRPPQDPHSVAGKPFPVERHVQVLVVGAGPAGLAAAMEARASGLTTLLVDEHPLDPALFGLDVPFHFGGTAGAATRNHGRMLERVAASMPELERAFELGVEVELGVTAWGLFARAPGTCWLPPLAAGLADRERSWHVTCDRAILALGRRDTGLAFPGWEQPGVVGAAALRCLLERYDAFEGGRLLVLGSDVDALLTARLALDRGLEVAGIVEIAPAPVGPESLVAELAAAGVPILACTMVKAATADGTGRVASAVLTALGADGGPVFGSERSIACDTIVLATGAVPVIDLMGAMHLAFRFEGSAGGWVPVADEAGRTSHPAVHAVGDCAGLSETKSRDPGIARAEGRIAARAVARALGAAAGEDDADLARVRAARAMAGPDLAGRRRAWLEASLAVSGADTFLCLCEEVSCREVAEVRAPRYLTPDPARVGGPGALARLSPERAAADPDHVKRLTRAGMGVCQGRRCREQVAALLAREGGVGLEAIPPAIYRAPVRPLPLEVLARLPESPEVAEGWDVWFGIPSQWVPPWELTPAEGGAEP